MLYFISESIINFKFVYKQHVLTLK